jgi:hypothetical protein
MTRVLDVARIHLVNWRIAVLLPVGILLMVFLLNLVVVSTVRTVTTTGGSPEVSTTGGAVALSIFVFVSAVQAITQVFPFALGLSVTRWDFYVATSWYVTAQAVAFGLVLTLGLALERATGGWGVGMRFFTSAMPAPENLFVHLVTFVALLLASAAAGMLCGVVVKRWGQIGVYAALVGLAVAVTGAVLLITWQGWWDAVVDVVAAQPPLALGVGYPALAAVLVGGAGWLALRRATP